MRQSHKLIMGDFNFRDINWSDMTKASNEQHNSTLFIESIRDSFLFQHVTKPTRIRENNEPSILDLIFTNEEEMVSDILYESSLGKSDHLSLSFKFNNYSELNIYDNKYTRQNFFKGDYQSIMGQLELINWDGEMDGLDFLVYRFGARTFRPWTFRPRTFRPGHFGHGHFGRGHFGQWTFRPRTFRPWKKYILLASADGFQPFTTLQD